jgi:hypothetical protein
MDAEAFMEQNVDKNDAGTESYTGVPSNFAAKMQLKIHAARESA